jgi:prophage regulatory protein
MNTKSAPIADTLHRLPAVMARVGYGRASIYNMIAAGTFPAPVKLGPRAVAWRESDLACWIASRSTAQAAEPEHLRRLRASKAA